MYVWKEFRTEKKREEKRVKNITFFVPQLQQTLSHQRANRQTIREVHMYIMDYWCIRVFVNMYVRVYRIFHKCDRHVFCSIVCVRNNNDWSGSDKRRVSTFIFDRNWSWQECIIVIMARIYKLNSRPRKLGLFLVVLLCILSLLCSTSYALHSGEQQSGLILKEDITEKRKHEERIRESILAVSRPSFLI